jgi:predicted cupin superfamily sugar epimerase
MNTAAYWIKKLDLIPHPEGGHYNETYRSELMIGEGCLPDTYEDKRHCSTLIYFLLKDNDKSHFHRLKSDEVWLYHKGGPVHIYILDKQGHLKLKKLGNNPAQNESYQVVIPAGTWFAAELPEDVHMGLLSCMVAPGFDFEDFEMGTQEILLKQYPQYKNVVERLCMI